jgi:phosphonate transport system ATP-binding protein
MARRNQGVLKWIDEAEVNQPAISVRNLTKTFGCDRSALDGVSLTVNRGEMVALLGASGSGKSTLLRQISGLAPGDAINDSEIRVNGALVQSGGRVSSEIRTLRTEIGFVFQQFNLVGRLPVLTNVLTGQLHRMPLWRSLSRTFLEHEQVLAMHALQRVGIAEFAARRASTLSGGQLQRAAIARSLVQGAKILLADEPIASLDPESARMVMETLSQVNREDGCTVLVSLHQVDIAMKYCPRIIALHQGRVVFDGVATELTATSLRRLYGSQVDDSTKDVDPWRGDFHPRSNPLLPPVPDRSSLHV